MKRIIFILLIASNCYANTEDFSSIKECHNFCRTEYNRMIRDAGLENVREEDVMTSFAPIVKKTQKCFKNCNEKFRIN